MVEENKCVERVGKECGMKMCRWNRKGVCRYDVRVDMYEKKNEVIGYLKCLEVENGKIKMNDMDKEELLRLMDEVMVLIKMN